jgi:hypothetical protein
MPEQQRLPERVIVDAIDRPIRGVITVAEFNEIEVCEGSRNRNSAMILNLGFGASTLPSQFQAFIGSLK